MLAVPAKAYVTSAHDCSGRPGGSVADRLVIRTVAISTVRMPETVTAVQASSHAICARKASPPTMPARHLSGDRRPWVSVRCAIMDRPSPIPASAVTAAIAYPSFNGAAPLTCLTAYGAGLSLLPSNSARDCSVRTGDRSRSLRVSKSGPTRAWCGGRRSLHTFDRSSVARKPLVLCTPSGVGVWSVGLPFRTWHILASGRTCLRRDSSIRPHADPICRASGGTSSVS
jgi:hypothetical protein